MYKIITECPFISAKMFDVSLILHNHFNIGDIVKIVDNSYIIDESGNPAHPILTEKDCVYQIIDGNKPFPSDKGMLEIIIPINNMKIRNLNTGSIYYCSPVNCVSLMQAKNEVKINGNTVSAEHILHHSAFGNVELLKKLPSYEY